MGLMYGTGPLGKKPAGTFNFETAAARAGALYLEPTPKRIRVEVGGEVIADSRHAMLLHESGLQPVYYFPPEDVRDDVARAQRSPHPLPQEGRRLLLHDPRRRRGGRGRRLVLPRPDAGRAADSRT